MEYDTIIYFIIEYFIIAYDIIYRVTMVALLSPCRLWINTLSLYSPRASRRTGIVIVSMYSVILLYGLIGTCTLHVNVQSIRNYNTHPCYIMFEVAGHVFQCTACGKR